MRVWIVALALSSCAPGAFDRADEPVPGREDLGLSILHAHVQSGLSDEIAFDLPNGVASLLVEVRGASGQFRLAGFATPDDVDWVESGFLVTRDAREVPGQVDWLIPNAPQLQLAAGRYRMRVAAFGASDEDIELRLYLRSGAPAIRSRIQVDLLIGDAALDPADAEQLVDLVNHLYAPVGLEIADYTVASVPVATDVQLDQAPDAVARALPSGRPGAVHLVVVRGLEDASGPLAGYSLGLPGPFAADRPNAAVLVATGPFTSPSTNALDVPGLAVTCAHEIGHYLGLYHTSERDGQLHDPIPDTPECDGNGTAVCPDADNVMFWTGGATRHGLSDGQGIVLRRHPLSEAVPGGSQMACTLACQPPTTCAIWQGTAQCLTACDPAGDPCPLGSECGPADDGTFVCR